MVMSQYRAGQPKTTRGTEVRKTIIGAAIAAAAVATPLLVTMSGSANAATSGFTATQTVTNRSDGGANGGTWAMDNYTRVITLHGQGVVANSFCPGITIGACHKVAGNVKDSGHFTTQIGNPVPGTGSLNGGSAPNIGATVTGTMSGTYNYTFYTNQPLSSASAGNAPTTVDGDTPTTGSWYQQFFNGAEFWDASPGTGSWTYTAAPGSDSQCPNVSGRWVDASPDWGGQPVDGNILAPDSAHC